mmetsp:Transcript_20337/g.46134  ORF Transcript_20337/g.46134 Transcript_20337/m.46134 type:complete len:233 (-) Transcript_20337:684-1382(-)|eukprot:CAMPEP_0113298206 /NCGR_PEP_ID=MMETSP0010_2-20120614/750_1 /TAXON_ID=216773 ORGANISM="Corethron hystrix, Strain 308" /NCGR_SAMPLE_ID=MMETSP0010_2 /ASSEMBLY_ACC=CAM_ASM_000155 /LENGTH=232 /DNA_ID=CAMNT_0000151227 /DNA_START=19 /DNA_END=717 /DNA_ORIENTATION=+ /assembly_acc=CAM_ASM_000155
MATTDMTPEETSFTNAFNVQRPVLAGFSRCSDREELHVVRDGFYLGLASDLCPEEYDPVREQVVTDPSVAEATRTKDAFRRTVEAARRSEGKWDRLVEAVENKAAAVGSDLKDIWMTLENGRLEWLAAASSAHDIKTTLKDALENQKGGATEGDASDAKMIWMYALSLSVPSLGKEADAWRKAVGMEDSTRPLVGYKAELWDCRKDEWAPLDRGVQAAAERGGSSIEEAWKL